MRRKSMIVVVGILLMAVLACGIARDAHGKVESEKVSVRSGVRYPALPSLQILLH
jgi:hypothetical protein